MDIVNNKITKSEKLYENSGKINQCVALAIRYWISYIIKKDTEPEAKLYLYKAYHTAVKCLEINISSVELHLIVIFLCIEQSYTDKADEMLSDISAYKNYFKNNEPVYYIAYLCLSALQDIKRDKSRAARKYFKQLEEYGESIDGYVSDLAMAACMLEATNYSEAFDCLADCYNAGCRSVFFFGLLYVYYKNTNNGSIKQDLFITLANWCASNNIDISRMLNYYGDSAYINRDCAMPLLIKLYNAYPSEWTLREICQRLIMNMDYSEEAFNYYKEAEHKQITVPGLYIFLVKSAYRKKSEDINRYAMEQFLIANDMDTGLKVYIYHVLLNNKKLKDLADARIGEMVQFCMYCLENNMTGRMCNSLYKLLLEIRDEYDINDKYLEKAESFLLNDLFLFEIKSDNPRVKYVWIGEKEKKEMTRYELINGRAVVHANHILFTYLCFNGDNLNIVEDELTVTPLVANADVNLHMHFFIKGTRSFELLCALSRHCLSLENRMAIDEKILSETLELNELSVGFRMQVSAALGNILFNQEKYTEAIKCYKGVDENYLDETYLDQMLTAFVGAGEFSEASRLVLKKPQCISERTMFYVLKRLSGDEEYQPIIANAAYELLLKSWYDKKLLDIVLKYYKGSQEEWQILSRALYVISVTNLELDEMIINNCIWMHMPDTGSQRVFVSMCSYDPENSLIKQFVYYIVYEMIINNFKPEYETIVMLESIFKNKKERLLAYGLSHLYINNSITTFNSTEIINITVKYAEEDGVLFPVFKNMVDNSTMSPYIEKNRPFIYRCLPGKNVLLYYKTDDDSTFMSKKMTYFRFGMYIASITHFYGEKIIYYFSEEMPTGSIVTKENEVSNNRIINEEYSGDLYFEINNALLYEQMFKYDNVEKTITDILKYTPRIRGKIL